MSCRVAAVAALVMAAGRSSRMGSNKLLCEVDGMPLVRRAAAAASASRCVKTLVVTGFEAERVESALVGLPVSLVHNVDHAEGMSTSLRRGLEALPADVDAVVVLLADMPYVSATHIDALIAAFDPARAPIVVPERDGRRGNPVLWPRRCFAEMRALRGDTGARALLAAHAGEVIAVPCDSDAIFVDVDTPQALREQTAP